MASYANSQSQWMAWAYANNQAPSYSEASYSSQQNYPSYLADSMEAAYQSHQQHLVHHQQMSRTTESKPRLSKEEVEILEAEFQKNHKPNSSTKKALAESMRVENARINNWFQNRRAREKKENNIRKYEAKQKMERERAEAEASASGDDLSKRDLVASSAPFPEPRKRSAAHKQARLNDELESPASNGVQLDLDGLAYACSESDRMDNDQMNDYLGMSDTSSEAQVSSVSMQSPDGYLSVDSKDSDYFFGQYPQYLRSGGSSRISPSYGAQSMDNRAYLQQQMMNQDGSFDGRKLPLSPTHGPTSADSDFKSPIALRNASRRKTRPPPLSIHASRSYSNALPSTAVDAGDMGDSNSSMRRVVSASATPRDSESRSPYWERRPDSSLGLSPAANMVTPRLGAHPLTPVTPAIMTPQHRLFPAGAKSTFGLKDQAVHPPLSTPGLLDSVMSLHPAYTLPVSDDGLVAPSFASSHEVYNDSRVAHYESEALNPHDSTYQSASAYLGYTAPAN